jgi:hypothetical protein
VTASIDPGTRRRLAIVADLLAPAGEGMPAASEVETAGRWLDRIIAADPSLLGPLARLAECDDWDAIEALAASDPTTFETASFGLLSAYYLHPRVRRLLGYPGQGPSPILEGEDEHYLPEELIAPVIARGPVYVDPRRG